MEDVPAAVDDDLIIRYIVIGIFAHPKISFKNSSMCTLYRVQQLVLNYEILRHQSVSVFTILRVLSKYTMHKIKITNNWRWKIAFIQLIYIAVNLNTCICLLMNYGSDSINLMKNMLGCFDSRKGRHKTSGEKK